ncbi:MAG: hypothetical protein ACD_51C00065G0004 [uncultured bacterium]|nr:MAG: hypothetical protein ACD_51C00065G0004 [uncultured bacterium]OGJ47723.1 MAG: hypothetical protein A2244_03785 [Candidatus Peregrinibacteria bacterium RIFOXYA2_FULL_41_18]OGJ52698.1 MAG: hypothetical protein A2448_01650 [Candidatus Peregrinibacteria bacterium RIFOXYC2_FULL_41_22]
MIAILKFIFSGYSYACILGIMLATQITAYTAGANGITEMQEKVLPYAIGFEAIAILAALILQIAGRFKFGYAVVRKKEGYVFYFKKSALGMAPALFIAILIISILLTVIACAADVPDTAFQPAYLFGIPTGIIIITLYFAWLRNRWNVVCARDIGSITVKFAKFGFIPWSSEVKPWEVKEVIFKMVMLWIGDKFVVNKDLLKIKKEIDELGKKMTVNASTISEFIEGTKKMYPGVTVIIERIVLVSDTSGKVPIILNERYDFKSFVQVLFNNKKPVIRWKSRMLYHS